MNRTIQISFLALICAVSAWGIPSHCHMPQLCQAVSYADEVFKGKLISTEEGSEYINGTFQVEKVYKGEPGEMKTVLFNGLNYKGELKVGTVYLVFDYGKIQIGGVCNPTAPFGNFEAVEDQLIKPKEFSATGRIIGLTAAQRAKTKVTAIVDNVEFDVPLLQDNTYEFKAYALGSWKIRLTFPMESAIEAEEFAEYEFKEGRTYEYTIDTSSDWCNHKNLEVSEVNERSEMLPFRER